MLSDSLDTGLPTRFRLGPSWLARRWLAGSLLVSERTIEPSRLTGNAATPPLPLFLASKTTVWSASSKCAVRIRSL